MVSSADDVLEMSVVRGVRGVGEVCETCLARGGVGGVWGEWVGSLGWGFTDPVGTGGVCDMCLGCDDVGGVGGRFSLCPVPGSGSVGCCYGYVCCESGFFMYMTGSCICILC